MATAAEQISQIYVGYFNRAPDPAGLQYWITQLNNGLPLGEIADYFANEQETLDLYPYLREPALNSVDGFINQIYGNLFNRPADAAGLAFWKGQLESGAVSEGEFIAAIANGATGEGRLVLDNKVAVGVYFATELSQNNVVWDATALDAAYQALAGVTLDPASVIEAQAEIDTFVDTGAWPGVGETFVLTAGNHTYIGTGANDTFQGVLGTGATFTPFDQIDGAAGENTFQIAVQGLAGVTLPLATDISNIQTVEIVSAAGVGVVTNLTTAAFGAQVQELWQIGNASGITLSANGQTAGFTDTAVTAAGQPITAARGVSDATVALDNVTAAAVVEFQGVNSSLTDVTVSGAVAGNNGVTIDTLVNAATIQVDTINLALTSNSAVTLQTEAGSVATVDASESTGNLTINTATAPLNGNTALTALATFNGGSGNDVLTAGNSLLTTAAFALDAGAGNDTINFTVTRTVGENVISSSLTGAEGADVFNLTSAAVAGGNLSTASIANNAALQNSVLEITDFGNGADQISLVQYTGLAAQTSQALVNAALAAPAVTDLLTAVNAVANIASGAGDWALFQYQDNTYLYVDAAGGATNVGAGDALIQLTGVDLSDLTVGTGAAGTTIYA